MKSSEDTSLTENYDSTPDSNVPKQKVSSTNLNHRVYSAHLVIQRLKDGSQFWAILIGIDEYPHNPLHGCVSDARSIQRYLNEDLGVPSDHIQCLLGDPETSPASSPTHANIISALYSLIGNLAIANGDNILVYFAGAGARYDTKEYFHEGIDPIDVICPIDHGADSTYDISLREIGGVFS